MKLICYMMYKVFMFGVDFFFKNVFIKLSLWEGCVILG